MLHRNVRPIAAANKPPIASKNKECTNIGRGACPFRPSGLARDAIFQQKVGAPRLARTAKSRAGAVSVPDHDRTLELSTGTVYGVRRTRAKTLDLANRTGGIRRDCPCSMDPTPRHFRPAFVLELRARGPKFAEEEGV